MQDNDGNAALFYASLNNHLECVNLLLEEAQI